MKDISALTNITGNYLKTGNSPRFFVHVATSERKWATAAANDYTNRIQGIQSITDQIDAFGGMGTVSAANVDVLKLGEEIKFYSSASIFPKPQGPSVGAGRIYNSKSTYATARGATEGSLPAYTSMNVGQAFVSIPSYYVHRSFIQYDLSTVSPTITSCEEAYLSIRGLADVSDTDFSIYVVQGEWTVGSIGPSTFGGDGDSFDGWVAGTADYTGTILNEAYSTLTQFSLTETNYIRFNRAGRQAIVDNAGSVLRLMLLSSRDYGYDATPTGNEYVRFMVSEANDSPMLELIYNAVKPDNERARIYLCYNDATTGIPTSVSSMLNVWSGVVDSWALDQKLLSLDMRHDDFKRNVKLNSNIMDNNEFANIPDENIGKVKPIVIGDFTTTTRGFRDYICSFTNTYYDTTTEAVDFFKGYQVSDINTDVLFGTYMVSEYALSNTSSLPILWESSIEAPVTTTVHWSYAATGQYYLVWGINAYFPYVLSSENYPSLGRAPIIVKKIHYIEDTAITNPTYSQDNDATNWSIINHKDDAWIGENYDSWGISGMFDTLALIIETQAISGYSTNFLRFAYVVYKEDGTALVNTNVEIDTDGQHIVYINNTSVPTSKVNVRIVINGGADAGDFNPSYSIRFRNICVARGFSADFGTEVYFSGDGIADTGGTYTGNGTALIENPSDIIRWFVMVKGGLSSGEIDSSFTTTRTDLSSWKFAFQFGEYNEKENLFNYGGQQGLVDALAEQCNSTVWWDNNGTLKMHIFDITDGFPTSATDVPADLDIFEYEGSPVSSALTRHPLYSFNLSRMMVDETYNDFVLKYRQNYATGDYDSVLTFGNGLGVAATVITDTNIDSDYLKTSTPLFSTAALALQELADLTSSCYTDLVDTTNTLVFEAWAIRDEQTATRLLQKLIEWHSRRRFKITLTTGLNAIAFELGDFINVRTDDIEDQFGTAFMYCKKWKIIKLSTDLVGCKIEIEAVEADIY